MSKIKWVIDPAHSEIGFKVKHLMVSNVRGRFRDFYAGIYTTGRDFRTAEIDVWINPASVDTGTAKRDEHLRSADFFDVAHFKEISFTAASLYEAGKQNQLELFGELTMKGIKKSIRLDVEFGAIVTDPYGMEKALFSINGKINRKEWGLNYNTALEAGGVLVSEDVWIECEIQLIKQD